MTNRHPRILAACALALSLLFLCAGGAAAHDFWVEALDFEPGVGDAVGVRLFLGNLDAAEPYARNPEHVAEFFVVGPTGVRVPVVGRDGYDPAGVFHVAEPGMLVVGYRSTRSSVTLPADRFAAYLEDQGLDVVRRARARQGAEDEPAREVYSRCAKALVRAADGPTEGFDRVLGLPLEIVPVEDPFSVVSGDRLSFRVTFRGKPVPFALLVASAQADPSREIRLRTDAAGRAAFSLSHGGAWMLHCVHMVEAPEEADADWESFWSSLTFRLPAPSRTDLEEVPGG